MSSTLRLSIGANIVLLGIVAALLWRDRPVAPPALPASARPETPKTGAVAPALPPKTGGPKLTPAAIALLEQMGISRKGFYDKINKFGIDLNAFRKTA